MHVLQHREIKVSKMIKNIKGLFGQYIFEVFILIGTIYFFMDEYNSNMNRYDIAIELELIAEDDLDYSATDKLPLDIFKEQLIYSQGKQVEFEEI